MWTCLYRKAPHEPISACALLQELAGQSTMQDRSVWPQGGVQGEWRRAASLQLFASTRGESHYILRGAHLPFSAARMPRQRPMRLLSPLRCAQARPACPVERCTPHYCSSLWGCAESWRLARCTGLCCSSARRHSEGRQFVSHLPLQPSTRAMPK